MYERSLPESSNARTLIPFLVRPPMIRTSTIGRAILGRSSHCSPLYPPPPPAEDDAPNDLPSRLSLFFTLSAKPSGGSLSLQGLFFAGRGSTEAACKSRLCRLPQPPMSHNGAPDLQKTAVCLPFRQRKQRRSLRTYSILSGSAISLNFLHAASLWDSAHNGQTADPPVVSPTVLRLFRRTSASDSALEVP